MLPSPWKCVHKNRRLRVLRDEKGTAISFAPGGGSRGWGRCGGPSRRTWEGRGVVHEHKHKHAPRPQGGRADATSPFPAPGPRGPPRTQGPCSAQSNPAPGEL